MIHIIRQKAMQEQIDEMLEELDPIIKLAVDIQRDILTGGGEMHADCESVLIKDGSHQEDIWAQTGFHPNKLLSSKPLSIFVQSSKIFQWKYKTQQ